MMTLMKCANTWILNGRSPFSNGLCERHNDVLEDMFLKVTNDNNINFDITLQWVTNAKNLLSNVLRFSPYQLVFGKNPNLPNVLNNDQL